MTISAANVAPDFAHRRRIHANDLRDLQEPAVIFEHHGIDSDGAHYFIYTVAGWLGGENIATIQGGATVGGDVIVIHADRREDADQMAGMGLEDTINALMTEDERLVEAMVALDRLNSIGALDRMDIALSKEKNADFVEDVDKVRVLTGDDIILTSGH